MKHRVPAGTGFLAGEVQPLLLGKSHNRRTELLKRFPGGFRLFDRKYIYRPADVISRVRAVKVGVPAVKVGPGKCGRDANGTGAGNRVIFRSRPRFPDPYRGQCLFPTSAIPLYDVVFPFPTTGIPVPITSVYPVPTIPVPSSPDYSRSHCLLSPDYSSPDYSHHTVCPVIPVSSSTQFSHPASLTAVRSTLVRKSFRWRYFHSSSAAFSFSHHIHTTILLQLDYGTFEGNSI